MEKTTTWSLAGAIADAARANAERPALSVAGETFSYRELLGAARQIAAKLPRAAEGEVQPVTAFVTGRKCSSYLAVLACVLAGHTYVPINLKNPPKLNLSVLRRSGARRIVCGESAADAVAAVLAETPELEREIEIVRCTDRKPQTVPSDWQPDAAQTARPAADAVVYILFTSGSTGESKGVPISHGNFTSYLDCVRGIMDVTPEDRFSQAFEQTFDVSEHDMHACWIHGAHLMVPSERELIEAADFIRKNEITCWFSVPSLGHQIRVRGQLIPGSFPSLRWSLFAGEGMPTVLAQDWVAAAPNGILENWYGPTEATICVSRFRMPTDGKLWEGPTDLVPIGKAFDGMELLIWDEDRKPVPDGKTGELILHGRQVACGYLNDPEKTRRAFVTMPGNDTPFYRSGDSVIRLADGNVQYLGRIDNQVKIRGFRVELGAVEAAIRTAGGSSNVIALSWPPGAPSGMSIVAAVEGETVDIDVDDILDKVRSEIPEYMVPSRIVCMRMFPTNASGKADRKLIAAHLEEGFQREAELRALPDMSPEAIRLMESILSISRHLSPAQIIAAETLISSGMDSISFVSLTAEIERVYGIVLEQEDVIALAELSFAGMVESLSARSKPAGAGVDDARGREAPGPAVSVDDGSPVPQKRINRSIQFIERFPKLLQSEKKPMVPVIGSSGVFRGIIPDVFDETARGLGADIRSINVGLPHVSCKSIARVCEFVRDQCLAAGVRLPLVIYEMDPMQISVLPPKGEVDLHPVQLANGRDHDDGSLDKGFCWSADEAGAVTFNNEAMKRRLEARWEGKRDQAIARTYLGDVAFEADFVADWIAGARALSAIADRVVGFVHPPDPASIRAIDERHQGTKFADVMREMEKASGVSLIRPDAYALADDDFMNVNHVNPWSGMKKLSEQLAQKCFG